MKLDMEGHECVIIRSMKKFLQQYLVPYIFLEWGLIDRILNGPNCPQEMAQTFDTLGYKLFRLQGGGLVRKNFSSLPGPNVALWDLLYVKNSAPTFGQVLKL